MGRQVEMRWGRCMIYKTGMDNGWMKDEEFRNQACERYEGCGMRNSEIRVCESYEGCYRNHDAVFFSKTHQVSSGPPLN